jgi:L-fucose isomerase-like protein
VKNSEPFKLAVIVGNRGFFPQHLVEMGRAQLLESLSAMGVETIALGTDDTPFGSVESLEDARKCASVFDQARHQIDGVLVSLPNFGDERAAANTIRWSGLNVPVLVHAFSDDSGAMTLAHRRDAFCGKISICNNLRQYGIPYSLTKSHTLSPDTDEFQRAIEEFQSLCRVVNGLRGLRVGVIGARPAAFNTVRFSEVLLERQGISVEPIDLSEVIHRARGLEDTDPRVDQKIEAIRAYLPGKEDSPAMLRIAKLGVVIDEWMQAFDLTATAIQCWTALEEILGIVPCTLMSMMSNNLFPSACETDIPGVISMAALGLASNKPSAIVDWNNNYGQDPNKCVVFHCSNLPKDLLELEGPSGGAAITHHPIISVAMGEEHSFGSIDGRLRSGVYTFCRVSTDALNGKMRAYIGEATSTEDSLESFGGYGVIEIPHMQDLLHYICEHGFEHHVAINPAETSDVLDEAFTKYLGWEVYHHH